MAQNEPKMAQIGQFVRKSCGADPKKLTLRLKRTLRSFFGTHLHPNMRSRTPKCVPGAKYARYQFWWTPRLKTGRKQAKNRPKWGLLEAVWALLTPRTGCGREKTRIFAKNRNSRAVTPSGTSQIRVPTPQFGHASCRIAAQLDL